MNRTQLLHEIAVTGYNVLYSAKKHFATYDIVEKAPGWITISTIAVGIFGLVIPSLTDNVLSAAILVVGIASIYFNQFQDQRAKYAEAGSALTSQFNRLRNIYNDVKSRDIDANVDDLERLYKETLIDCERSWLHRHIFLSDWYAHYKIFWQAQIGWLDEELHFRFWRDKVPLTLSIFVALSATLVTVWAIRYALHCPT